LKIQRLLAITMLLLSQRRISGKALADKFEVSLRTIYRDLDTINSAGIPIISYTGADGGYEIMEQFRIDRQIVTSEDLQSILTALKGIQSSLHDQDMDHLLAKIKALVAKSEQNRIEETGETLIFDTNMWNGGGLRDKTMLTHLRQAAKNRTVVSFIYMNTNSGGEMEERTVEPVGLAWKGHTWYLYAYCRLRGDYRTFRLSRIRELKVRLENFNHRGIRLEELDARWGQQDTGPSNQLVLLFSPRVRIRVEDTFGMDAVEVHEDGSLLVKVNYFNHSWIFGMILSYGPDVQVLEPASVADIIKSQAEQIYKLYDKSFG
jgi:predicted DNA-binding transcriptional regulator YafY